MKTCWTCDFENNDEALFCSNCGNALTTDKVADSKETKAIGLKVLLTNIAGKFPKWYFLPITLIVLIVVGLIAMNLFISSNPVMKTMYGLMKYYSQTTKEVNISIETDIDPAIDDLFNNLDNAANISFNKKSGKLEFSYEFGFEGDKIIDIVGVYDEGYLFLDIPQVLDDRDFYYLETEDYIEHEMVLYASKYMGMIDFKGLDIKSYTEAIVDAADDNIEVDGNQITYRINEESSSDVITEMVEMLAEDEAIPLWIQRNGVNIFEEMIEDDFEYDGMNSDDYEDILGELEDKDFVDEWLDYMKALEDDLEYLERDLTEIFEGDKVEIEVIFTFSTSNRISNIEVEIDGAYGEGMTIYLDLTEGYDGPSKYDIDVGNNLEDIDFEDIIAIADNVVDYLDNYIKGNEELEEFLEDYGDDYFSTDDSEELIEGLLEELMGAFWYWY